MRDRSRLRHSGLTGVTVQHILTNEALADRLVYGKRPKPGNPAVELVRMEGFFPRQPEMAGPLAGVW